MAQPTEYENISYNAPGGAIFGETSTDKVGFYGVAPVARPVTISTSDVSTIVGTSTSSVAVAIITWGWASQAEINQSITAVSTMMTTLKALGLIAGGVDPVITRATQTYEILDYGSPDGAQIGRVSTEFISFYGATPVTKDGTSTANISTATTVSASTNAVATTTWGFTTSSEFAMYATAVSTMQKAMKRLGLMV